MMRRWFRGSRRARLMVAAMLPVMAGLAVAGLPLSPAAASGTPTVWTDGHGTGLWSDPGNWSNGVPDATKIATFDTTQCFSNGNNTVTCGSNDPSTIDTVFPGAVAGIDIAHYSGIIADANPGLTIGADGYTQSDPASTVSSSQSIADAGNFSWTAGSFTAPNLNLTAHSGTTNLALAGSISSLTLSGGTVALQSNLTVTGNYVDDGGGDLYTGGYSASVAGNVNNAGAVEVAPGGGFSWGGTMACNGALVIDPTSATSYGQFSGDIPASDCVNMELNFGELDDYVPSPGDTFQVLTCAGCVTPGAFRNVDAYVYPVSVQYGSSAVTVTVQGAQSISFTAPATGTVGGSAALTATGGGSGNPVVFSVDSSSGAGVCTVSGANGATVNYTAAGTCVIDANQAGNADYTAAPQVSGTITVGAAAQSISFTAPATGTVGGSAALTATGGGSGNPVVFSVDSSSGAGVCTVSGANGATVNYTAAGTCVIDANQAGNADYTAASQVTQGITVDQAPAFVLDSPPLTAVAGQAYGYTFQASGTPAPSYALAPGAPSWLSVNAATGQVTGTPPAGTTSFSYSVTATNTVATATAGPFTVTVAKPSLNADIAAALSCPATLIKGGTGTCTLAVTNAGPATAAKVVTGIALPSALSETSCTSGCARHANVFTWSLGSLASGASAKAAITVKASAKGAAPVLAAAASQNPDPHPLNNIAIQQIAITK